MFPDGPQRYIGTGYANACCGSRTCWATCPPTSPTRSPTPATGSSPGGAAVRVADPFALDALLLAEAAR
ncbi:hypothetical protein SMICM304S_08793 [Streptomyces microflavus]